MTTIDTGAPVHEDEDGAILVDHPERKSSNTLGFAVMVVGMFMAILDIQIVASSLADIQAGISASREEISWIQTSYLIAEVVMIPLSGWLSHLLSTRVLFTISAGLFTLSSMACAVAWNLESMIAFRVLQGFLGGAMIPTVFATSYLLFRGPKQATVTVFIGLVATMAPTIGPTLGGYLTDTFSWHWLFLINVVPGIIVTVVVWTQLDVDRPNLHLLKAFDLPGIILVALFLGTLQYVLEEGPGDDWFQSHEIALLTLICVTAAILFFWRELTTPHPVVDLRAFSNPNFALGCLFSFIVGIGLYGSVYVMPLFLAMVRGYNALEIGWVLMVTGGFQFLSAPLAGALSKKLDPRVMLGIGLTFFGLGLYLSHALTADWSYWEFFLPQAVRGISLMFIFIPVNALALGTLPPDLLKGGSGLYNLMRNLGGAIGLAVINTMLTNRHDLHLARLSETFTAARDVVTNTLSMMTGALTPMMGGDAHLAAMATLSRLAEREAYVMAFGDVFQLMAIPFIAGLLFLPIMRKVDPAAAGKDAH